MVTVTSEGLVHPARIEWRGNQCYAPQYADVYGRADAAAEARSVYIQPSAIVARAAQFARVMVGELGFGTGLNFVATAAAITAAERHAYLHFVSIEKHPLRFDDWQHLRALRAREFPLYEALATHPLPLTRGWHRRVFCAGRVVLSVYHGDAMEALADLNARQRQSFDAWYLDGFTPQRNPELWRADLLRLLADTCHTGTRVATFTAAGEVRRRLQAVGFEVSKVDQRPHKRESLVGEFVGNRPRPTPLTTRHARVFGAGFGGATLAHHLAQQGIAVDVIDPRGIATGASCIPAALLHGRLLGDNSPTANHRSHAFHYARAYMTGIPGTSQMPVVQRSGPNMSVAKLERIAAAYQAHDRWHHYWLKYLPGPALAHYNLHSQEPGLLFPSARLVDLPKATRALLDHSNIRIRTAPDEIPSATSSSVDVICSGLAATEHVAASTLEIAPVPGQIDQLANVRNHGLVAVVGNGYFVPRARTAFVGATYEYQPWSSTQASTHNISNNTDLLPPGARSIGQFRGTRAVTSDRMPVVGRLDEATWIATAHGSMGTTSAPYAAALVAAELCGWLPPADPAVMSALAPGRFAERQRRRGKLVNGRKSRPR